MKEYNGIISFTGRVTVFGKALSEEEFLNLLHEKLELQITSADESLEISEMEWDLLNEAPRGNVRASFVQDSEIWEE